MDTYKVWYGGDRRTVTHLMQKGCGIRHVNENVIEVHTDKIEKLRHTRGIFVLDAPRTSLEAALVEAASAKGYFRNA